MNKHDKKNKILKWSIFLSYAIFTLIVLLYHENWRDEAQSWLIARELNLFELFQQLKYEGHPALWYLILMPFAKVGLPYITANLIAWTISIISAFLFIKYCPISFKGKIVILLSSIFLYDYTIFARSYCLILLFVILLCIIYPKRKEKPILYHLILALLANTHIIMLGFVGMIWITNLFCDVIKDTTCEKTEKKKRIVGLCISAGGVGLLFLQIFSSVNYNSQNIFYYNGFNILNGKIMYFFKSFSLIFGNGSIIVFWITLFGIIGYGIKKHLKQTIVFLGSFIFQIIVYVFIYAGNNHIYYTFLILLLYFLWSTKLEEKEQKNIPNKILEVFIFVLFILNALFFCLFPFFDLTKSYSGSKDMANYIKQNIPEETIFLCTNKVLSVSIIPYLSSNYVFIDVVNEEEFTYIVWDDTVNQESSLKDIKKQINQFKEKRVYIIATPEEQEIVKQGEEDRLFEIVYEQDISPIIEEAETFILIKVR